MIVQCVSVPAILVLVGRQTWLLEHYGQAHGDNWRPIAPWCAILAWATAIVTLWSAVPYVTRAVRVLRTPGAP